MFSSMYARICYSLWAVCFGGSLVAFFIRCFRRKQFYLHVMIPTALFFVVYALGFAVGGTDVYDYKQALLPMIMCYLPISFWMRKEHYDAA